MPLTVAERAARYGARNGKMHIELRRDGDDLALKVRLTLTNRLQGFPVFVAINKHSPTPLSVENEN